MTRRAQQRQGECEGRERAKVKRPRHTATVFNNEGAVAACCARACFFFSLARALALRASCVKIKINGPTRRWCWLVRLFVAWHQQQQEQPAVSRANTDLPRRVHRCMRRHACRYLSRSIYTAAAWADKGEAARLASCWQHSHCGIEKHRVDICAYLARLRRAHMLVAASISELAAAFLVVVAHFCLPRSQ